MGILYHSDFITNNTTMCGLLQLTYVLTFNEYVEIPLVGISILQARFACLRCAAVGHFVSARASLRSPGGDIG